MLHIFFTNSLKLYIMITSNVADLFIEYAKSKMFNEIKTWVDIKLNTTSTVTSSQLCYGNYDEYYWETFKFYVDNRDLLFSINIGTDSGRNDTTDTVIFIEANIYSPDNENNWKTVYVETNTIEDWKYTVNKFYKELSNLIKTI